MNKDILIIMKNENNVNDIKSQNNSYKNFDFYFKDF